jgi:regulatory protein
VSRTRKPLPPLNALKLRELALRYLGRYATSRARLHTYLARKIRERGWDDSDENSVIEALVADCVRLGFVDDAAFAASRARALTQRGLGLRRISEDLRAKGIEIEDSSQAREQAENDRWTAADRFARRKRIGPYGVQSAPPEIRQKQMQAFARAGHSFDIAKKFVCAEPGEPPEFED